MKRYILFPVLLLFLIILPPFVNVQAIADPGEKLEGGIEKVSSKWDYLGEEWKNILLKNEFVSAINSFFEKISFIFVFLFGEPYSLSLTLFVIIIIWFYLFFQLSQILRDFVAFSSGISKIISFGVVTILAQVQILRKISEAFGWVIFSPGPGWVRYFILIIMIFILGTLYRISSTIGKQYKNTKEKQRQEKEKLERKTFGSIIDGLLRGFGSK